MKEIYSRKEAMKRLGLRSVNAFLQLESKYPEAFVIVKRSRYGPRRYDKAMLDRFAEWRERFQSEKP
jgi:hypothetical protein